MSIECKLRKLLGFYRRAEFIFCWGYWIMTVTNTVTDKYDVFSESTIRLCISEAAKYYKENKNG